MADGDEKVVTFPLSNVSRHGHEPSAASGRGVIEAGAIALLSNLDRPAVDLPSPTWLGHSSTRAAIRGSGLWNVNHVAEPASDG